MTTIEAIAIISAVAWTVWHCDFARSAWHD